MLKLKNCNTPNTDSKVLKSFLDQNKDSIFLQIDKSKDLAYLDLHDYIHKLISVFSPDKFEKLSRNPLEPDLKLFQAQIRKMEPFLTLSNFRLIKPYHSIKKGHGILKVHKPGMPLRPIINSMFSITSGAEKYILNIIKPIVDQCSFSVPSTMLFTEKFKKFSPKFNRFHEVVGFDAVNLFTSINVPRVVQYILDKINLAPAEYFTENSVGSETDEIPENSVSSENDEIPENNHNSFPPRNIFQEFLLAVLLKFSAFWNLNGYYRQQEGLSMGSKLSPALANIFYT